MSKYLDLDGLEYYTGKIKEEIEAKSDFDSLSNRPTYNNQQMTHSTNIPVVPTKVSDLTNDSDFANKAFVNSSITTNTATFRGTSQPNLTEAQFLSWANTLTKTNNDYIFWNTTDSNGNIQFKRYKYNGSSWEYEYTLNNSSFTAEQWASINSGATTDKLDSYVKKNTVAIVNNMKSRNLLNFSNCNYDYCDVDIDWVQATSAIEDGNYCEIKTYELSLMIDFDNMTGPKTFTMSCISEEVNNRSCSALIYGKTTSGWSWTEVGYAENSNSVSFTINPNDYLYIEMFAFRFNQDKNNTFTDTESVFYGFQFEEGNAATNYIEYFDMKEELDMKLSSVPVADNLSVGGIKVQSTYGIGTTNGGDLYCRNYTETGYNSLSNNGFISKGTLETALTSKELVPVSGTDDGTNWSTLTINGTTKNIPVGGGSSKVYILSEDNTSEENIAIAQEWWDSHEHPENMRPQFTNDYLENYCDMFIVRTGTDSAVGKRQLQQAARGYTVSSGMSYVIEIQTIKNPAMIKSGDNLYADFGKYDYCYIYFSDYYMTTISNVRFISSSSGSNNYFYIYNEQSSANNVVYSSNYIENNYSKTWNGTLAEYNAITTKDANTVYLIHD